MKLMDSIKKSDSSKLQNSSPPIIIQQELELSEDKVKPFVQSPFDTPIIGLTKDKFSKFGKRETMLRIEAPTAPKATRLPIVKKEF